VKVVLLKPVFSVGECQEHSKRKTPLKVLHNKKGETEQGWRGRSLFENSIVNNANIKN